MFLFVVLFIIDSFVPLSLDRSKKAVISLNSDSNECTVDYFDSFVFLIFYVYIQKDNGSRRFKGCYKNPTTNGYCLVFRGDYFSLERVGGCINQLALGSDE